MKIKEIFFISLYIFIIYYIYTNYKIAYVSSSSMTPTLNKGDYLLYQTKIRKINKYDILLFKENQNVYIKRCWGLPGDTLFLYKGKFYNVLASKFRYKDSIIIIPYNGLLIKTTNPLYELYKNLSSKDQIKKNKNIIFTNNYYYLIGDNFINSVDSRIYGPINENRVVGKMLFKLNFH